MKINILVSTIDKGIFAMEKLLLKPCEDISYIISHQYTDPAFVTLPDYLKRPDVSVSHISGKGVTKSRNNAIKLANAEIGVFADDDVTYEKDWLDRMQHIFKTSPTLDVAIFKIKTLPGEPPYKPYPTAPTEIKMATAVGTIQIAFRVSSIKANNLKFDERFGAGQKLLIGSDEQLFIYDCLRAGLRVKYFPEYLVQHPYQSTVKSIPKYDHRLNRVTGGLDARMHGWIALPKALLGAVKYSIDIIKHGKNPLTYFIHRFYAALYILITKN